MSILARQLLRAGRFLKNGGINPARWSEGLGHKLGFRMRQKVDRRVITPAVPAVEGRAAVGEPSKMDPFGHYEPNPNYIPAVEARKGVDAVLGPEVPYLSRPLTGAGMAMQGIGYAGLAGGVGTLGYNMMGDGTEPATDASGVKNPAYNEEMAKFRTKFQTEKLGGDKLFSPAKYRALRSQNAWVDTAIQQIGKENYLQLKQQLADGKLEGGAAKMHSILTDAIAEIGDEEVLKQAGTQPYVLPGLASRGDKKRVIVIAPMKSSKSKDIQMQAMQYGIYEDQQQQQQQK